LRRLAKSTAAFILRSLPCRNSGLALPSSGWDIALPFWVNPFSSLSRDRCTFLCAAAFLANGDITLPGPPRLPAAGVEAFRPGLAAAGVEAFRPGLAAAGVEAFRPGLAAAGVEAFLWLEPAAPADALRSVRVVMVRSRRGARGCHETNNPTQFAQRT
jgi:hypothetical protein